MKTPVHLLPYFARQPIEQATLLQIEKIVCDAYRVRIDEIHGHKRPSRIAWPRQICMYLMVELVDNGTKAIGDYFNKDHSTVVHAHQRVETFMRLYPDVQKAIQQIRDQLTKEITP